MSDKKGGDACIEQQPFESGQYYSPADLGEISVMGGATDETYAKCLRIAERTQACVTTLAFAILTVVAIAVVILVFLENERQSTSLYTFCVPAAALFAYSVYSYMSIPPLL